MAIGSRKDLHLAITCFAAALVFLIFAITSAQRQEPQSPPTAPSTIGAGSPSATTIPSPSRAGASEKAPVVPESRRTTSAPEPRASSVEPAQDGDSGDEGNAGLQLSYVRLFQTGDRANFYFKIYNPTPQHVRLSDPKAGLTTLTDPSGTGHRPVEASISGPATLMRGDFGILTLTFNFPIIPGEYLLEHQDPSTTLSPCRFRLSADVVKELPPPKLTVGKYRLRSGALDLRSNSYEPLVCTADTGGATYFVTNAEITSTETLIIWAVRNDNEGAIKVCNPEATVGNFAPLIDTYGKGYYPVRAAWITQLRQAERNLIYPDQAVYGLEPRQVAHFSVVHQGRLPDKAWEFTIKGQKVQILPNQ